MAINFDSLVIDRVVEAVAEDSNGNLLYLLNNLSNVSINTTSDTKDKVDSLGVLIKRFYTAKSVEVSADCNLLSLSALAEQFGTEKVVASAEKKILVPKLLRMKVSEGGFTIPENIKPVAPITKMYAMNANGTLGKEYTAHTSADQDKFSYETGTRKITFPTDPALKGKEVLVKYEYETQSGVKVSQMSDKFPRTVCMTFRVLVSDVCSVDVVRSAYIVIPKFQTSPDVDLTLETDSTIAYSGVAQRDYCSANSELYYVVISEDDTEE